MADKAWTLINTEESIRVEVEGIGVWVKPLTNGQRLEIAKKGRTFDEQDGNGWDDMLRMIGQHIDRIEGYEGKDPCDIIVRLKSGKAQLGIVEAVTGVSGLNEDEVKNSVSSPVG